MSRAPGLLSVVALGPCLVVWASGCSLLVDTNADQCAVNADCTRRGGEFAASICRSDHTCVSLKSPECKTLVGSFADEHAFVFGSVLPTAGPDDATGRAIEDAIELAVRDFQQTSNGLPPAPGSSARRPLAFVGCNDGSSAQQAVTAAKHLVDVGIPAIIGAAFSGITITVATEVTIPRGALLISPSATSTALTDLDDHGLLWRTSPSDVFQAEALALFVPRVETAVRSALGLGQGTSIKLAIVHKGDAYGSGLAKALEKKLVLNGAPVLDVANKDDYLRFDYGNPDDPKSSSPRYADAVKAVLAMAPHVVLVFGTNEGVTEVFRPIEAGWGNMPYRARFLFSDGGLVNDLWDGIAGDDGLRQRVLGTAPGTDNILFKAFREEYLTQFSDGSSPDVFGAAGGYDAAYLLAYAAVASRAAKPTGAALAAGLAHTVPPGTAIDVGTEPINAAFPVLQAGGQIDFDGASGPLDFDVKTGEAPSDIQIWCLPKDDKGKATSGTDSGLFYDASSSSLRGKIGAQCGIAMPP